MGFWLWAAEKCLAKERPRMSAKNKRQFFIDAEKSQAWDPDNKNGWGNREVFTVQLSKWLHDRPKQDVITIDELVDFLHDECVYLIRKDNSRKVPRSGQYRYRR